MYELIQYIIVRVDLETMSPGRAAAQCAHAANDCVKQAQKYHPALLEQWEEGDGGTGAFGKTYVLMGAIEDIKMTIKYLQDEGHCAGITHDPTYAVKDGDVTHYVPVDTCGWVLGNKEDLQNVLGAYDLLNYELHEQFVVDNQLFWN